MLFRSATKLSICTHFSISIYSWLSHHPISLHLYVWRLYGKVLVYKAFLQSRFLWVRWELGDDSRRTVSVIWVGCYRVITIPLEEENYLDTAGKVCKPMMDLLYLDISSFTPLCLSLFMHIPSRQAVAFIWKPIFVHV